MVLKGNKITVILNTTHVSMKKAIEEVKKESILKKIVLAKQAQEELGIPGKIAVAGLNPHNGEEGLFGDEESREIEPAVKEAREAATGGLTPAQINSTVNSIASAFDNEQIVKNYNTAQEGYQTLQTIGTDTKNPADDIAFIYAFAKIMDPNSVVREGEYNTIQKYAQSWAQTFGFNAKRIFSNTNFLSKDAKEKMLQALTPKINTISKQYENVYNEYQRQIQDAYAGKPRSITQYSGGTTGATTDIRSQVINMGYDYDAMIKDGMTDSQIKEQLGL